jgi:hypothetical protein
MGCVCAGGLSLLIFSVKISIYIRQDTTSCNLDTKSAFFPKWFRFLRFNSSRSSFTLNFSRDALVGRDIALEMSVSAILSLSNSQ